MTSTILAVLLVVIFIFAFSSGKKRVRKLAGETKIHSLPGYYGVYAVMYAAIPAFLLWAGWTLFEPTIIKNIVLDPIITASPNLEANQIGLIYNDIQNLVAGRGDITKAAPEIVTAVDAYRSLKGNSQLAALVLVLAMAVIALKVAHGKINPDFRARQAVERIVMVLLITSSCIAILTTVGIVLSLIVEASRFFAKVPFYEFLFGLEWSPQTALRADQVGSSGSFGAIPVFAGTLLISFIAMVVAAPIGLFSAIYMSEYASSKVRAVVKPLLEILAGIPTVVYGFFAALTVAPFLRDTGANLGIGISSESALAAGLVMGIMIIPFVSSLSDDVISAVPNSLREGSYGLGATRSETIKSVILPAALPGIVGSLLLAASRAIGETMIVVMAAGLAANLTANPFAAVTTVTVQIVTLLVGDQEFDSPKTLAAFALGLMLFFITLLLNIVALRVVRKYREQYD
ncbi:phosphate ABC transporter permease subunit PstC [Curvivirga sp.]|uniref:phosphate ABC transporter permease subunit PstC n=1 Tax=Curvivirga sp. TaxID=2856848 RepID=UPI003B59E007